MKLISRQSRFLFVIIKNLSEITVQVVNKEEKKNCDENKKFDFNSIYQNIYVVT